MQPKDLVFGGGAAETFLHPVIAIWLIIAALLILLLPRNKAIVPFLLAFFTIPFPQVILVGPLHFPVVRILILVGWIRRIADVGAKDKFPGKFNKLDRVAILWGIVNFAVVTVQWMSPLGTIKFLGDLMDTVGGYLVARYLIVDREGVRNAIKAFALVCVIQGVEMMSEQHTYHNIFSVFGANEPTFREGHVRSEGPIGTLFAGTLAGVLIPMFIWLRREKKCSVIALAGIGGAVAMVYASHASTSWGVLASGLLGLGFWFLRRKMRLIRYGIAMTLIGLHLVMHGPVWSLIEKVDLTGGSSNYHRYMLVDNCIRHFSDWWLIGYKDYGSWGFDMWDLCNQFVATALTGGLISLVLFIAIYCRSFSLVGTSRKRIEGNRREEWFAWCLGATLFANVTASFGINYMIQLQMALFPLLACVCVAANSAKLAAAIPKAAKEVRLARAPAFAGGYYLGGENFGVQEIK